MKRRIAALAALSALLLAATAGSIRDRQNEQRFIRKNQIKYKNFNGTPRNTVIFYGGFHGTENDLVFRQVDPEHDPEVQATAGDEFFISKPVRFGTRYVLEYWYWTDSEENYEGFSASRNFTEDNSPLVIDVPYEPGFYYFGYYDGRPSITTGQLVEWDKNTSIEMKPAALKQAISCYRGTEWAPLLREELKKAKAELKEYRANRRASQKAGE